MFDAFEWLVICLARRSHAKTAAPTYPTRANPVSAGVRYYGFYSNVARGKRKKAGTDDKIPCTLGPELTEKAFSKNRAHHIQKIYEVEPLTCSKKATSYHYFISIHFIIAKPVTGEMYTAILVIHRSERPPFFKYCSR